MGREAQTVSVTEENGSIKCRAQTSRAIRDSIEHGLDVRRRTADHP
jgi:hypothetical protein